MRFRLRGLFLFTGAIALAPVAYRWWPIDGVVGNLLSLICEEDTVWTGGYSNDAFRAIRVGMSRREVYSLLGPPINSLDNGGGVIECWTHSPDDGHYRRRELTFQSDQVIKKVAEFYVD